MSEKSYDIIIIGSGPGGYVCALKAAQLGMNTAIVERHKPLGGTCLNVGCIPSKALLHSSEAFHFATHHAAKHGIVVPKPKLDLEAMMKKKDEVVGKLNNGVQQLIKGRKVDRFTGTGTLAGKGKVAISGGDADGTELKAKAIVLATGSLPVELPFMKFDGKTVVSSDHAIAFDHVPKSLVVVGAGAIGLELGSVWSRLGAKVTVVELLPQIAPTFDKDIARLAQRYFKKQGMEFALETKVTGVAREKNKTYLNAESKKGKVQFEADKILVAVGRRPAVDSLNPDAIGLKRDRSGRIEVNQRFETNVEGVYAIGDIIHGPMLAHKAEEDGVALAEQLAGKAGHVDYDLIPNVIYTSPEIASVGLGEDAAKEAKRDIVVGKFGPAANGRALAMDATEGIVKVIADKQTDRLLGAQILCHSASELIGEVVAHMEYGGSAEDLARTVHAHPTLSECLKEAALATQGSAIHAL